MQLAIDLDSTVLVSPSSRQKVYHAPGEDGEPICNYRLRVDPKAKPEQRERTWLTKTPRMIPHHSLCNMCKDRLS